MSDTPPSSPPLDNDVIRFSMSCPCGDAELRNCDDSAYRILDCPECETTYRFSVDLEELSPGEAADERATYADWMHTVAERIQDSVGEADDADTDAGVVDLEDWR